MKIDVKKIAELSNLVVSDRDSITLEKELNTIVEYIEQLNEIDTKNIPPTSQVTGLTNIFREDSNTRDSLSQKEALSGTTTTNNGLFKVKQLIEQ